MVKGSLLHKILLFFLILGAGFSNGFSQSGYMRKLSFHVTDSDWVKDDGKPYFSSLLKGGKKHDFAVYSGDKPFWIIKLPGESGLFRLAIVSGQKSIWLSSAAYLKSSYRPGMLLYDIADTLLGKDTLKLKIQPGYLNDVFYLRCLLTGPDSNCKPDLMWVYDATSSSLGKFCSDSVPSSESELKLLYEYGRTESSVSLSGEKIKFLCKDAEKIVSSGAFPDSSVAHLIPALSFEKPLSLWHEEVPFSSAVMGRLHLKMGHCYDWSVVFDSSLQTTAPDFILEEKSWSRLRNSIEIETPDSFVNAMAGALSVNAWNTPGWAGAWAADALGWHDKSRRIYSCYFNHSLNKKEAISFSSSWSGIPDSSFFYQEGLLQHWQWTGNWDHAPIEYKVSDPFLKNARMSDFVTCKAFLKYQEFLEMADLSKRTDSVSYYATVASRLLQQISSELWIPLKGVWAESETFPGGVHPNATLWTISQAIMAGVADPFKNFQALLYIDESLPHFPFCVEGISDHFTLLSTSNWMPYRQGLNNVSLPAMYRSSLAYWLGNRSEEAFKIWKSALLESSFLGNSPGNFAYTSFADAHLGYCGTDCPQTVAMFAVSLTEGLFGIRPNMRHSEVLVNPGIPRNWDYARLQTADFSFDFKRDSTVDRYRFKTHFKTPVVVIFRLRALRDSLRAVVLNGASVAYRVCDSSVGEPYIEIRSSPDSVFNLAIQWSGNAPDSLPFFHLLKGNDSFSFHFPHAKILSMADFQHVLRQSFFEDSSLFVRTFCSGSSGCFFLKVTQGFLQWWLPARLVFSDSVSLNAMGDYPAISLELKSHVKEPLSGTLFLNGQYLSEVTLSSEQTYNTDILNPVLFIPGTNELEMKFADGSQIIRRWTCWDYYWAKVMHYSMIDLKPYYTNKLSSLDICDFIDTLHFNANDLGLRHLADAMGYIRLPQGIPFRIPSTIGDYKNITLLSLNPRYSSQMTVPVSGMASHVYFLMTGTTGPLQSRMVNGVITVNYQDGSCDSLEIVNPDNWPSMDQRYERDRYAFSVSTDPLMQISLKTGNLIEKKLGEAPFNISPFIDGGAATVLDLPLCSEKELASITITCKARDIVIGLMGMTIFR